MRRCFCVALLLPVLAVASAAGSEKADWKTWFRHLLQGLESSSVDRYAQGGRPSAVVAVRGAGQKSSEPHNLYWKGGRESRLQAEARKEKEEFKTGVELILNGKTDDGIRKLDEFKTRHPKSRFLPDVEEALHRAQEGPPPPGPKSSSLGSSGASQAKSGQPSEKKAPKSIESPSGSPQPPKK